MVDRVSQDAQFGTGQAAQQQQSQVGAAQADANAYATSRSIAAPIQTESSGDRILQGLMGSAVKVLDNLGSQYMQKSQEEAYLKGQAAATTGQNEADLQTDIFTRNWATAGFRDTMGRIAMSDNASRVQEDMARLRELPPEKFSEYMDERRAQLLPSLDGMSMQARKGIFSSMALDERAVFHQQAAEHRKFVWEQQQASIQAKFGESKRALDAAAGAESPGPNPLAAYGAATDATLANMHALTIGNPNVPIAARSGLIYEGARDALASNHQQLYEKMKTQPVPDGNGGMTTMLDQLTSTDRAKLEASYRESLGRTAGARSVNTLMEFGTMQAQWADPNTPLQPAEEVKAKIEAAFHSGFFGDTNDLSKGAGDKAAAIWKTYAEAALKKKGKFEAASAWFTGNVDAMRVANKTRTEAMNDWQQQYGSKMPLEQNVGSLITASLHNGQYEGLTLAGDIMKPALNRLLTNPSLDPDSAKLIGLTFKSLEGASKDQPAVMHAFLQSFDPDTQEMLLGIQGRLAAGASPTDAVLQTQSKMLENSKLDSATRLALAGKRAEENAAIVANSTSSNALQEWWGKGVAIFSGNEASKNAFVVKRKYFENPERVADAQAQVKFALAEELQEVSRNHQWADAGTREKMANAAVASRSTMTSWGPMIVPKGQTMQSYFGVKDTERVGEVLSSMVPMKNPDNRIVFGTSASGNDVLTYTEYNSAGVSVNHGHFDPKSVAAAVQHKREQEVEHMNIMEGKGSTVKVNNIPVNFSGSNSLGIPAEEMYAFRARLIKHEGVVDQPANDIGGVTNKRTGKTVQTGGVGLSDTNTYFPKLAPGQKMTPEQISNGLRDSSEEAAKTALHWQTATGLQGSKPMFQLYSELAFQGGGNNKAMAGLLVEARARNYFGAAKALHDMPAYTMSGPERRKFYDDTLTKALKD